MVLNDRRTVFVATLLTAGICFGAFAKTAGETPEQTIQKMLGSSTPPSQDELVAVAKKTVQAVSLLRELPAKSPVAMEVRSKAQIRAYIEARIAEELKPEELAGQEAALKKMGLLPQSYSLKENLVALYEEQIAGYYDPFQRKFYIADWIPIALQEPIMAHELTHALQDQQFDLRPYLTPLKENSDATSARQALVEGDAVLTMMAFTFSASGMDVDSIGKVSETIRNSMGGIGATQYPVFSAAPNYLKESLLFSYAAGADFALARKKLGGWKNLTATYKNLPESSEQILHPELYPKDKPVAVTLQGLAAATPKDWTPLHTDVLGELGFRVMLGEILPRAEAERAATGWGGDRYRAYRAGKAVVVVEHSVWDTVPDAQDFEQALRRYAKTLPTASSVTRTEKHVVWIVGESAGPRQEALSRAAIN